MMYPVRLGFGYVEGLEVALCTKGMKPETYPKPKALNINIERGQITKYHHINTIWASTHLSSLEQGLWCKFCRARRKEP